MIPRRCSGELYKVLQVTKEATSEDVKKAYHKLALVVHPDKTGGATTEEFKKVQEANSILSDPSQRKLYDTFGREGMKKLQQYNMGGAAGAAAGNPMILRCVVCIGMLMMFDLIIFVALVVANIDNSKGWSWVVVFTPIWILLALSTVGGASFIVNSVTKRSPALFFAGLHSIVLVSAMVRFARSLDGKETWGNTFIPWFILCGTAQLSGIFSCHFAGFKEALIQVGFADAESITPCSLVYIRHVLSSLLNPAAFTVFISLLYHQLCEKQDLSYWVVFSPLYAVVGLQLCFDVSIVWCISECKVACTTTIAGILKAGLVLYTVIMVNDKVQKEVIDHRSGPSAAVCCIVVFIVQCIATISICCACCFSPTGKEEETASEYQPVPPA